VKLRTIVLVATFIALAPPAFDAPALAAPAFAVRPHRAAVVRHAAVRPPVAGDVLVAVDASRVSITDRGVASSSVPQLDALLTSLGLTHAEPLWPRSSAGTIQFLRLHSDQADFDPRAAAEALRAVDGVRAAVPNLRLDLHVLPNDPDLSDEWFIDDGGTADVRLPAAWDITQGSASVRIGIMDTGVDLTHPDLASKIWTNPGEIPGNGIDDDGDGYIDDVHGWDFGNNDNDPNPHAVIDTVNYGLDEGFHGTFVAGLAAAATNNGEGIAGTAWNCTIVPLKVVDLAGDITTSAVTAAFGYAAQQHLDVLNMSFGSSDTTGGAQAYFQALVDQAIAAGVVCVASAGNDNLSTPNYPAACAGVLSVAATNSTNMRSSFSNWGPWVKVAAPGENMWSALCQNYVIDDFSQLFYEVFFGWDGFSPYMEGDGTSYSAPMVSGVCALVRSQHPTWSPAQVALQIVSSGDAVTYDAPIGIKLNAARAVGTPLVSVTSGAPASLALASAPNPFPAGTAIRFQLPAAGDVRLRVYDCGGRLTRELDHGAYAAGPHTRNWDGTDAHGNAVSDGIYFVELTTPTGRVREKIVRLR
jgi:subtilisin family serine protease